MSALAFITIREAGGRVVGPLHATAGGALQIAELAPGHARMMLVKPASDEGVIMVDLRGAQIVGWQP